MLYITHITLGKSQLNNLSRLAMNVNGLKSLKIDAEELFNANQLNLSQFRKLAILDIDEKRKIGITLDAAHLDNLTSLSIRDGILSEGGLSSFKINNQELLNANLLDLSQFKKLTTLDIQLEDLTGLKLAAGQFNNFLNLRLICTNLKFFDLDSKDKISSCPLSSIYFYFSMTTKADLSFLAHCGKLVSLKLTQVSEKFFPKDFSIFTKLQHLDIKASDLTAFPVGITGITSLSHLRISGPIAQIPTSIASLQELYQLSITSESLTEFPSNIEACSKLKELWVKAPISEIPMSLAKLNLSLLSIESEKLTRFPTVISQMKEMFKIYITAPIVEIPKGIKISAEEIFLTDFLTTQIHESVVFDCKQLCTFEGDRHYSSCWASQICQSPALVALSKYIDFL